MSQNKPTSYYSKPALAQRYGVHPRSIDRWRADGKFPQPDIILPSGQPRWRDDTIELHERRSASYKSFPSAQPPGMPTLRPSNVAGGDDEA
jgi:hypothetical protein